VGAAGENPGRFAPTEFDAEGLAADAAAIAAVRAGEPDAFGPLVARHLPRLHGLLRRFFASAADVDDLTQAAFVRAYEQLDRFDVARPFYPWLRKIAVNLALHELERRRRRREVEDPDPTLGRLLDPALVDGELRERELVAVVSAELARLPPQWAAVFRLRVFEELSYAEIAEALGIPIGTVMSSLARARLRLAERLSASFGPGTDTA
jgi:RNA polymerase sigma-70 factor (ECF subfamily)